MRLRPLNPAVTGYTHGPTGVEYVLDEHGTITVPIEVAEALLEYPNTWVIDHTVTGPDPEAAPPEDDDPPAPNGTSTTADGTDGTAQQNDGAEDPQPDPSEADGEPSAAEPAAAPDDDVAEPDDAPAAPAKPTRTRKSASAR